MELQNLIPGLPDDIAVDCLVRVPQEFHSNMKSVCHNWHNLISHPSFYQERLKSATAEHLVFLIQPIPPSSSTTTKTTTTTTTDSVIQGYTTTGTIKKDEDDYNNNNNNHPQQQQHQQEGIHGPLQYGLSIYNATHDSWHRIRPKNVTIPMFCQCLAFPSSDKLVLLGGWDPTTLEPVADLYILDFIKGECRRAAPMSVARSFFACAVVGPSTVYVAGGHDNQKNALRSAEVYDVDADEWKMLPPMTEERDECQGLAWDDGDDKFWVVSGYGTDNQGEFRSDAEYYDPLTGCWSKVDGVWPFGRMSPRGGTTTVSVNNGCQTQWWWLLGVEGQQQQRQHGGVKEYEEKEKKWKVVSSIPLPNNIMNGTSPCVTNFRVGGDKNYYNKQQQHIHRVFVMSGGGGECEGKGAFIMERDWSSGNTKWNHIHTPVGFSGFPYSASYLLV